MPAGSLKIGSIVIRCYEFGRMFAFWQEALHYVPKYPPEEGWVLLRDPAGRGPNLSLDKAPQKRSGKRSWLHLDLYAGDQETEVERLVGLGATRYPWRYPQDADYVVLEDPDGNLFCVVQDVMTRTRPPGFLATPSGGAGPGVLVLHAWWGLNDTIRAVCTRLAEAGFTAFAPDLYHGKVADNVADAEALAKALDANHLQAKAEIARSAAFLAESVGGPDSRLAVMGFSLGAYYALDLAVSDPERIRSVVIFYGTGVDDHTNSRASYLCHFAENDGFEPQSNVDALEQSLKRAGRPVTLYRYPGTGHWFFEPDRSDAYDREAAELAWERTVSFLKTSLSPQIPARPDHG